jgi:hypothetical protein
VQIGVWDISNCTVADPVLLACSTIQSAGDVQTLVAFNGSDAAELVTNGKRRAIFWRLDVEQVRRLGFRV